MDVMIPNL